MQEGQTCILCLLNSSFGRRFNAIFFLIIYVEEQQFRLRTVSFFELYIVNLVEYNSWVFFSAY